MASSKSSKKAHKSSATKRRTPQTAAKRSAAKGGAAKRSARTGGNGKDNRRDGLLEQPKSPMPPQHQAKPGQEHKLKPRPRYEAPEYVGAGKLKDKVALITGAD